MESKILLKNVMYKKNILKYLLLILFYHFLGNGFIKSVLYISYVTYRKLYISKYKRINFEWEFNYEKFYDPTSPVFGDQVKRGNATGRPTVNAYSFLKGFYYGMIALYHANILSYESRFSS